MRASLEPASVLVEAQKHGAILHATGTGCLLMSLDSRLPAVRSLVCLAAMPW